jgi:GNAT superfamily N-acetyltransferase
VSDQVVIRELLPGEVDRVVAIALAAWEPIFASYRKLMGEALFAITHPDWRAEKGTQIRRACEQPERVLVAEVGHSVAGFVTFYLAGRDVGEIGNNAVHPDYQGRGIAGRLYEEVFARLRAAGRKVVKVGTGLDPGHTPARRAYEKAGFSVALPGVTYWKEL